MVEPLARVVMKCGRKLDSGLPVCLLEIGRRAGSGTLVGSRKEIPPVSCNPHAQTACARDSGLLPVLPSVWLPVFPGSRRVR
jgi:hypothetical protein